MGLSMRGISILFLFFHAKAYVNPLGAGNSCFSPFACAFRNLQQVKKRRQLLLLLLCLRLPEPPASKKAQAILASPPLPAPSRTSSKLKSAGKPFFSSFAYAFQNLQQVKKRRQTLLLLLLPAPSRTSCKIKKRRQFLLLLLLPTPSRTSSKKKSAGNDQISHVAYAHTQKNPAALRPRPYL